MADHTAPRFGFSAPEVSAAAEYLSAALNPGTSCGVGVDRVMELMGLNFSKEGDPDRWRKVHWELVDAAWEHLRHSDWMPSNGPYTS